MCSAMAASLAKKGNLVLHMAGKVGGRPPMGLRLAPLALFPRLASPGYAR